MTSQQQLLACGSSAFVLFELGLVRALLHSELMRSDAMFSSGVTAKVAAGDLHQAASIDLVDA